MTPGSPFSNVVGSDPDSSTFKPVESTNTTDTTTESDARPADSDTESSIGVEVAGDGTTKVAEQDETQGRNVGHADAGAVTPEQIERLLPQFEGLVATTTRQIMASGVELEADDVRQLLSIKVWESVRAYDPRRGLPLRRWVFGCLYNCRKDIVKRPRRHNSSLEEVRQRVKTRTTHDTSLEDWFDGRYLSVDADQVYFEVEDEPVLLPSTLTAMERRVVRLRLKGRLLLEIDSETGLSRAEREQVMRSIREKLADWAPSPPAARSGPNLPLPGAQPTRTALAA